MGPYRNPFEGLEWCKDITNFAFRKKSYTFMGALLEKNLYRTEYFSFGPITKHSQ
jgi:hypothetical protein